MSSTFSLLKQAKEKTSLFTTRSTDTLLKNFEVSYINTSKAWEALKSGDLNIEPEYLTFTSDEVEQNLEIPGSGRSTPHHDIPYIHDIKVSEYF